MSKIHVVIANTSTEMFWTSIAKLLASDPEIELHQCPYGEQLNQFLRQHQPQILILEKNEKESTGKSTEINHEFLKSVPGLSIIVLDPISTKTLVNLQNVGCKQLVDLIKTLSSNDEKVIQYVDLNGSCVPTNTLPSDLPPNNENNTSLKVPYSNDDEYFYAIKQWLDLTFLEVLSQEGEVTNPFSAPGWAMNVNQVRALIGGELMMAGENTIHSVRLKLEDEIKHRETETNAAVNHIKLLWLFKQFKLSHVERWILLLVFSPEIDAKYASVFGYLNDNLTRRWPTATLIARLALICQADLSPVEILKLISTKGSITRYGLIELEQDNTLSTSDKALKPADELLNFLLNDSITAQSFEPYIELIQNTRHQALHSVNEQPVPTTKLNELWQGIQTQSSLPVLQINGESHASSWFTKLAYRSGYSILTLDISRIPARDVSRLESISAAAARSAKLYEAILLVIGFEALEGKSTPEWVQNQLVTRLKNRVQRLAVSTESILILPNTIQLIQIQRPDQNFETCKKTWLRVATSLEIHLADKNARELASIFRFDDSDIVKTIKLSSQTKAQIVDLQLIKKNARLVARGKLPTSIKRVKAVYDWDDIVLDDRTLKKLQSIPVHVRFAEKVFEEWGFKKRMPYGRGVAALLSGVSGTGKTMASQIIANDLGVDLFQVDLSKTVSKYIGETEKNLDQVFSAAEKSFAVLLFDEADAIFGKRSEVRDAHDRHANVEVAYLLQRIESFTGLVILTTNFKRNLDTAFMRRMRFVINFEAPDYEARLEIWKRVFPEVAEFEAPLDFSFLARRLELTGGNIQQIAVRAAFRAAAELSKIKMEHIVNSTREEARKLGLTHVEKTLELIAA